MLSPWTAHAVDVIGPLLRIHRIFGESLTPLPSVLGTYSNGFKMTFVPLPLLGRSL